MMGLTWSSTVSKINKTIDDSTSRFKKIGSQAKKIASVLSWILIALSVLAITMNALNIIFTKSKPHNPDPLDYAIIISSASLILLEKLRTLLSKMMEKMIEKGMRCDKKCLSLRSHNVKVTKHILKCQEDDMVDQREWMDMMDIYNDCLPDQYDLES